MSNFAILSSVDLFKTNFLKKIFQEYQSVKQLDPEVAEITMPFTGVGKSNPVANF